MNDNFYQNNGDNNEKPNQNNEPFESKEIHEQEYTSQYNQPNGSPQDFYQPQGEQNPGYSYQSYQKEPPKVDPYGGNMNYQWHYDDYAKAVSKPKKNKGLTILLVSLCSLFGVALISLIGVGAYNFIKGGGVGSFNGMTTISEASNNKNSPNLTINQKPTSNSTTTSGGSMTIPQIAKSVSPSIVGIESYSLQPTTTDFQATSEGSGIILTKDGYIVTNAHVIQGADSIKVVLSEKNEVEAKLIGSDSKTDIAVLKIEGTNYPAAPLGDSNALEVGEDVVAIGNPGGLQFTRTVTRGIISATNRTLGTQKFIQTDTAINPGNSGGALINMFGQVIGITSQKIPTISDISAEGMGFAIPMTTVKDIAEKLIRDGYVKGRVTLGVSNCQNIDDVTAKTYNLPVSIHVLAVEQGSNAAKAGLRKNDFITKINNTTVKTTDELIAERDKFKPGDRVTLTVYRYSTKQTMTITFVLQEDKGDAATSNQQQENSPIQ